MSIYYVSTTGSDGGNGSSNSPFRTIQYALDRGLSPGDEIVVRAGTYQESLNINRGGSAAGNVTLRAETPGSVHLDTPSGGWNGISINANYVTVQGFEISDSNGDGIEANNVHHIEVLDNVIHGSGESGIQFNWSEFIRIEGNTTYENASDGWFSGISVYQNRNVSGDTTTDGYRTIIRNNTSYENVTESGQHTDGNGIIIDDFQSTQTGGYPSYTYATLVENNLVYLNGGKGIQVTWSDNVTVRGNTAWHNNQDDANTGTWRGEISNSQSSDNTYVNNIAVADPSANSNNTAIDSTSYGGYTNDNVVWANNLTYAGAGKGSSVRTDGGNDMPSASDGNLLGVNPGFVNAPRDFHLSANSAAVDAGTGEYSLPVDDLDGMARVKGVVDIGAYERGASITPQPEPEPEEGNADPNARNDKGFTVTAGVPLVIDDSVLLANDMDPDGDALSIARIRTPQNGTAELQEDGSVVFTPFADFSGLTGFRYHISDGNGGSDSALAIIDVTAPRPEPDEIFSIWEDENMSRVTTDGDNNAVELGLKFRADVDSSLNGLRVFVTDARQEISSISLWSGTGRLIANAEAGDVSGTGWKNFNFDAPVELEAGTNYVASYFTENGRYAASENYFDASGDVGPVTIDANAGLYAYAADGAFPDQSYNSSNYWVDLLLETSADSFVYAAEAPSADASELLAAEEIAAAEASVVQPEATAPEVSATDWHGDHLYDDDAFHWSDHGRGAADDGGVPF